MLEHYAALKDLESRAGIVDDDLGDIRILSVKGWAAHDLLLLVRDDLEMPVNSEISGIFGITFYLIDNNHFNKLAINNTIIEIYRNLF